MIEDNLARGVQLYKHPHDVLVTQNTIVGNGRAGVQVAIDTADATVANNIVAYNGDTGIRSHSLSGTPAISSSTTCCGITRIRAETRTG